jgi:predicted chitinase
MRVDRGVFQADLEGRTGLALDEDARAGLSVLLDAVETDPGWTQVRDVAYFLATVGWETAHAFRPVRERPASQARQPALWAAQQRYWPSGFYGRGYIQITWERNYRLAGQRLAGTPVTAQGTTVRVTDETFVEEPDLVLDPAVAYLVAARGMREGWFTGKKLSDYIRDGVPPDYVNARRVINGLDSADAIAAIATGLELVLRAATAPTGAGAPAGTGAVAVG